MTDEIEELWELAEECRAWAKIEPAEDLHGPSACAEFARLAKQLDEIAGRIKQFNDSHGCDYDG